MPDFKNDEVAKMLEMLKEQAENTKAEDKKSAKDAAPSISSDDDIKNMLKKHFSAGEQNNAFAMSEDYSFDTVDFGTVDDEIITGEIPSSHGKQADENVEPEEPTEEKTEKYTEELLKKTEEYAEEDVEEDVGEYLEEDIEEDITEDTTESVLNEAFEDRGAEPEAQVPETTEKRILSPRDEIFSAEPFDDNNGDIEAVQKTEVEAESISEEPLREALFADNEEQNAYDGDYEPTKIIESIEPESEEDLEETIIIESALSQKEHYEYSEPQENGFIEEEIPEYFYNRDENNNSDIGEPATQAEDEEPISEESINYDEVLEGQQGTVFNSFVEDFTGDLDDVVFEAEITESHAPDKQYTIFEDWEQLMKDKDYATAEDGIIPPTKEELANSASIASKTASGNTDYFNAVGTAELDAVDIALMVALGGESELNQTVGFEKIRQAVHDADEVEENALRGKEIYGCTGEEYTSEKQNEKIKQKYKKDKIRLIIQTSVTALFTLALILYEVTGWIGLPLGGIFSFESNPEIYVLAGLQLLFLCAAVSYNKFRKLFKNLLDFSSTAFIGAILILLVNIPHDVLILAIGYADMGVTFHSLSAFLMLLGLIYDLFEHSEQSGVFNIVSSNDKKLVLEPYGKLRVAEEDSNGDIIDTDSYCISRVPSLSKFFTRISKPAPSNSGKLISLILSISVSLCVMLVLLLMGESLATIVLSFVITLSFTLICSAVFETEFAFFAVHKMLKKYKTGIVGKVSVAEYSKCNIVYFDDFNVFNKKSVRTKGLKLYDNNEIYRVLYHTQAVFSKVGGPLKGVFEFATSEMNHSKNVEIKEISREGIGAVVDGRTSVLIGTGSYMKSRGIHPSYTPADIKAEEKGEESIMFIALNGSLGAKLYVTYQFSSEFERLARKLTARGVGIGIRSCDPNINNRWAKKYGNMKKMGISIVRPTLKEVKPYEKSIDGGVVSTKNVRALTEALMMCIRLDSFENLVAKMRTVFVILTGILAFALVLLSGINTVSMLALTLEVAFCASLMMLLTHFYLKH